jgi:transposase InsO family protein
MRRQGLVARIVERRRGLTKRDKNAPVFPDLVHLDFTASEKWVGDITEIPTARGKPSTSRAPVPPCSCRVGLDEPISSSAPRRCALTCLFGTGAQTSDSIPSRL